MRADIQFSKLGGVKRSKFKQFLIIALYFALVVAAATALAVYAYFSATATATGTINFGEINVNLMDSSGNFLTNSSFSNTFSNIYPGDTLDLTSINVKNTGSDSAYVLLNVDISISATGATTLTYNKWYNVGGEEVNTNNMAINTTEPTIISANSTVQSNIYWQVPGDVLTDDYQNATATVTVSAYGAQTNLEESKAYVDADLYASYYICKNAATIAETSVQTNSLANVGTDPISYTQTYKLEQGSVATGFVPYKYYTAITTEPLMQVNSVADTIDYTTSTITHNIAKIELTGEESTWYLYGGTSASEGVSFRYLGLTDKAIGYSTSVCSHFSNVSRAWVAEYVGTNGIYSDHSSYTQLYFRAPTDRRDIDTVEEWTAWLAEQYAAGTPVTIWYQLATATTETFFASKNLYSGSQNLYYQKGGSNNCSETATVKITQDATADLDSKTKELGGDLFTYLSDKIITISCKIKRYTDDVVGTARIGIAFYNTSVIQHYYNTYTSFSEDGEWIYLTITAKKTAQELGATQICLWFADYAPLKDSDGNYLSSRHFEIKDIQLEIGSSPTDYEAYDKTTYAYVNGTALRAVGEVKDTYSYNTSTATGTITRNVVALEIDTVTTYFVNNTDSNYISVYVSGYNLTNPPPENNLTDVVMCSHLPYRYSSTTYKQRTDEGIMGYTDKSAAFMMTFEASKVGSTHDAFKSWLAEERANGTPVTVYYILATSFTETI